MASNSSENLLNTNSCEIGLHWASVIITANVISMLVGGVGNSLVCLAVWKTPSLRSTINYYMASLAVADLIVTLVCQPLMVGVIVARLTGHLGCDSTLDQLYRAVGNFSCAASFFQLCCVSLEQLLAILRPLTTIRQEKTKRFLVLVSLSWFVALLYSVLRVAVSRKATSYFSAASFGLGYLWIILCYLIILISLSLQAKRQARLTLRQHAHRKNEKKITITMVLVFSCFSFMWLPFFCFRLSSNSSLNSGVYYELAITMAFCNSSFNAIIYSFRNKKYREVFKGLLFTKYHHLSTRGTKQTTSPRTPESIRNTPSSLTPTASLPLQSTQLTSFRRQWIREVSSLVLRWGMGANFGNIVMLRGMNEPLTHIKAKP